MARPWGRKLAAVGVLGLAAAGLVWWINRGTPIPSKPPANAPKVGACWAVTPAAAKGTLPWAGSPVPCASAHTAEVYHVGQVDHDLISRARAAKGDDAKVAQNLMPWSPAPCASSALSDSPLRSSIAESTPWAMSGDCAPIAMLTPQEAPSKPFFDESYPIFRMVSRTIELMSAYARVVTS